MATQNTPSQEYGNTNSLNYYQIFLKKGNRILMGSQIYTDFNKITELLSDIRSSDSHHIVSYVSAVPNLSLINNNLQRNHYTYTGSYEVKPNPDFNLNASPEPNVESPQPIVESPSPPPGEKHVSFSTPERPTSNSTPPRLGRFKTYSMNFTPSPAAESPTPESVSAPVSPIPHNSYFTTDPNLEVRGKGIKRPATEEDLWEHLSGEKDNMTESFTEEQPDFVKEQPDFINDHLFDGMTLEEYGKGYILRPPANHPDCGIKYYHDAWWRADLGAWFLKEKYLDYFLDNGALWKLDDERIDELLGSILEEEDDEKLFHDMVFEPYGSDGYLLQCYNTHPDYKKRNYHGGTWHRQGDGWFFPSEYREFLEDNGATFEYNQATLFEGMYYYKGTGREQYYLTPSLESKYYGLNGFEGAEWCHQLESWRFEQVNEKFFTDHGATSTDWN